MLNQTILDPSTDYSYDDCDSELRNVINDDSDNFKLSNDRLQPKSTTSDPSSRVACNSKGFFILTLSGPVSDGLPSLCADLPTAGRQLSGPCGADCWYGAQVSPATAE